MANDLFRKQVYEAQSAASARFGEPTATTPPAWSFFIVGLAVFFFALILFMMTVDFSRKESVRGILKYTTAEARIYANAEGVLENLYVEDRSIVSSGTPLFDIKNDRVLSSGSSVSAETRDALFREIESLQERKGAAIRTAELTHDSIEHRRASLSTNLELTEVALNQIIESKALAIERVTSAQDFLQEGLIAERELFDRQENLSTVRSDEARERLDLARIKGELDGLEIQKRQADTDLEIQLADIDQRIAQLEASMTEFESSAAFQVVAPIDGRVTAIQVRRGEILAGGRYILAIVPTESELFAELYLTSTAIPFVETGQTVRLEYDALPSQKFGMAQGTVRSVAETALLPEDLSAPTDSNQLLYRVDVMLDAQSIEGFGADVPLQSGMELSADIILEDRHLMDWVRSSFALRRS